MLASACTVALGTCHPLAACPEAMHVLQVHVRVKIPSQPSKEEKDLVEQLRELEGKKKDGGGFFGKFKL